MSDETIEQKFAETVAKRDAHWLEEVERVTAECDQLRAQVAQLREALKRAQAAMWDAHYGHGIDVGYAQNVEREICSALAPPAPAVIEREKVMPLGRKPREWWVNVYGSQAGYAWGSKEKADAFMCKNRIECVHVREVLEDGR